LSICSSPVTVSEGWAQPRTP